MSGTFKWEELDETFPSVKAAKEAIDRIVDKGEIILTKREYATLVSNPNSRSGYCLSRTQTRRFIFF